MLPTPSALTSKPLYWSNLELYEKCPQGFLWSRGWGNVDVGGGPGRKKPAPVEDSKHHAIMGIAIQHAIECMYNDELWKSPNLRDTLVGLAKRAFERELLRSHVDWRLAPSKDEMLKVILDGVQGYLQTMKQHKFLGPYARAEVDLMGYLRKWLPIGGRVDVIIRRDDNGVTIIDGKNGNRYKNPKGGTKTYTDPDQLRWYALCFYITYRQLPDRLGFVYYRFPYGKPILDDSDNPVLNADGTPQVESGVDWVPFTMDDLKGLGERAIQARQGMEKEKFDPTPTPETCKFCLYSTVCDARCAQKEHNRKNRAPKSKLELDPNTGFSEFSL